MFKKLLLCLLSFSTLSATPTDESYWHTEMVRAYVHNSEMQRRWALSFLAPNLRQLNGNEHILDIGCGDGRITADVSRFIPNGLILGIDPSQAMLSWAKRQYSVLEYPNLTFQEGGFLESNTSQQFDVIISNCALQHCPDQFQAFQNLNALLKEGGRLWLSIPSIDNEAWKQARKSLQTHPKWASYWKGILPRKFLTVEEYKGLLTQCDFSPVRVENIRTCDPFVDREEFIEFLLGTFTPAVPPHLAREFFNELTDEYLRLLPEVISSEGVLEARFGRIEIEAVKAKL